MAIFTSENAAQAVVKLVASQMVQALVGNLVMGNLVNRDFEPALASAGDQVNIPIPPVLTTTNVAEGGSTNALAPTLGNAQITLNSHETCSFTLPDVTRAIVVPDLIQGLLGPATIAVAEKLETDLLALYPNFTVNSAVGSSATLTEAVVDSAETALFAQKVPKGQPKYLIVSGTAYSQLRQLAVFRDYQNLGPNGQPNPSGIISGMLPGDTAEGKIKDLFVYRSQFIAKPSSTTYNVCFARDGIGLVVRRLPLPIPGTGVIAEYAEMGNFSMRVLMSYAPTSIAQQFTVDILYGCGVLRNSFTLQVQSN